jgi:hypothetical protein
MAFYGSSVANLCPILFKGNLFSEGVNIVFHSDISYSMNLASDGLVDYNDARTTQFTGTQIGAGSTLTMFYDGIFPAFLHKELISKKVGLSDSPNLYTYVDQTLRSKGTTQSIVGSGSEILEFQPYMILGDATFDQYYKFKNTWSNNYIDVDEGTYLPNNTTPTRFQQLYRTANASFGVNNRVVDLETNSNSPGIYSEDVHGTIFSLYYSDSSQVATNITEGRVGNAKIGRYLDSIQRRNIPTYFITASNEQENTSPSLINASGVGIAVSTKNFVGYTTSKYTFNEPGFYFRRYRGYYESTLNQNGAAGVGASFTNGVQISGSEFSSEEFREFFNSLAVPLTLGTQSTGNLRDDPGCNWYVNGTEQGGNFGDSTQGILGITNLGGTEVVNRTYFTPATRLAGYTNPPNPSNPSSTGPSGSGYKDVSIVKSPNRFDRFRNITNTEKGGFWGPVQFIDRFRSDIQDYSAMALGYFQPLVSGTYRFRLQSIGASFLWIASDDPLTGQINQTSVDNVYNNWRDTTANILCPSSSSLRYAIRESDNNSNKSQRTAVYTAESTANVQLTAGRFYPFRIIMGNPQIGGGDPTFPADGDLEFATTGSGSENPSSLRLLFRRTEVTPDTWQLSGDGFFFGGTKVWEEGSPFFPPPVTNVTRTLQEELVYRNIRVIGISNYDSDEVNGETYDAVFVNSISPASYKYVKLNKHEFSEIQLSSDPGTFAGGNWRFASHFKIENYGVHDDDNPLVTQFPNQSRLDSFGNPTTNTVSTGASFSIGKLNDRYTISVVPGFEGTGYRIGDIINIDASLVGEDTVSGSVVFRIDSLVEDVYSNRQGINYQYGGVTAGSISVQKGTGSYTYTVTNAGSGYNDGDIVRVKGGQLDGVDGTPGSSNNDLVINITSVDANGSIVNSSLNSNTGTPTNYIDYPVNLTTFSPRPINIRYDNTPISSISYRNGTSSGIAYTHVSITSIGYTNTSITGIAYSSYSIAGIAYTAIDESNTVGIAYSSAQIVGISYTTNPIVGAAYTHGSITGVAYTGATITSIGYSSSSVTSIGYTSPNIVSIGYTAFQISSIAYPDQFAISGLDIGSTNTTITINDTNGVFANNQVTTPFDILITGVDSAYSFINGSYTVISISQPSPGVIQFTIPVGDSPPPGALSFVSGSLIVTDNGPVVDGPSNVAIGTAVLQTSGNHTFSEGDQIIIRGINNPSYSAWGSTVLTVGAELVPNVSFYVNDTSSVGFYTNTSIGAGSTVGYDQAELELVIPATIKSVGITSIAYNLNAGTVKNPYLLDYTNTFAENNINGIIASYEVRILQPGSDDISLTDYLINGDVVYIFETGTVFDYTNTGYGLTVTDVRGGIDRFSFNFARQGSNVPFGFNSGYYIIERFIPIVDAPSHGFNNGELVSISGNENSVYNGTWRVAQAGINTFRLANSVTNIVPTAADLITNSGNKLNLSGIASASITAYPLEVGMGITAFGITGNSSIYNDGYVIVGIKSAITEPYAFTLKENQTPTQLVTPGTSGKIGIHTSSGIATVTNTSVFGSPNSTIQLKIQNSPGTFFNQVYTNAVILDSTRILLGSESFRNQSTANPIQYSSSLNVNASTISGRVGSPLLVTHGTITPSGFTFSPGSQFDVYGTTNFNGLSYTVGSISGNTLTLTSAYNSTTSTNFSSGETGNLGVRNLLPFINFTNNAFGNLFRSPLFGNVGQTISVKLQGLNSTKSNLEGTIQSARIISSNQLLLLTSGANPIDTGSDYTNPGIGGTVGLIGSRLLVRLQNPIVYQVGDQIGIQNIQTQFGGNFTSDTITVVSEIINNSDPYIFAGNDVSVNSTNFGLVGSGGISGLIRDAIVTTNGSHPFVTNDQVKIQGSVGNVGIFNYDTFGNPFVVTVINSTSFYLNGTTLNVFVNDFNDANATGGVAGLLNYPATVTSINHPFQTAQTVKIEGNSFFNGSYVITKIDNNRFRLNNNSGVGTDFTQAILNSGDPIYIALRNQGVTVTYDKDQVGINESTITSAIRVGDSVKIQNATNSNYNGTYTVTWATNTSPYRFGIIPTEPSTFDGYNQGSGGIVGLNNSKLRVRANSHNLVNGQSITVQSSSPANFNGTYTVSVLSANIVELSNGPVSDETKDYTQISTSGVLGYPGYPAIATLSQTSLPTGIVDGSELRIVGSNQPFSPQDVTIKVYRNNGVNPVLLGLTNATNPANYSTVFNNSGFGYTGGLRNVDPIIRFNNVEAEKLGLNNTKFQIGNNVPLDVISTTQFQSGFYDAKLLTTGSTYSLQLINARNPSNNIFVPSDVNFRVGLANSDRVVRTSSHGFTQSDVGVTAVFINTNNNSLQASYGGDYFVSEIIDSERFAVRSSPLNTTTALAAGINSDYTVTDVDGYYVKIGVGPRLTVSGSLFNQNHALLVGDTLTISGTTNFNGSRTVSEVLSPSEVRLSTPYPSPLTDGDGTRNYNFTPQTGTFTRSVTRNAGITVRRSAEQYVIQAYTSRGANFRENEQFVVSGTTFNGISPDNNLVVRVSSTQTGGAINSLELTTPGTVGSNDPDSALDYDPRTFALQQAIGDGSGAAFNVIRRGEYSSTLGFTTYSQVTLATGGQFYQPNESILIQGSQLGGKSPDNDLIITIESVGVNGAIVGTGFTYVGISSDGSGLKNSGITTIYQSPSIPGQEVSKPIGLEETWRLNGTLKFTSPPPGQGELKQTHDMLTLAKANRGGVVKSSRVFQYGDIDKKAEIFEIFAYGTRGADATTDNGGESNIIYDTNGNSGIATITLRSDETDDEQPLQGIKTGDTVYILSRIEPGYSGVKFPGLRKEPYTDYTIVGYGFTVLGVYSNANAGTDFEVAAGRNQTFSEVIEIPGDATYNGPISGNGATIPGTGGSGYRNPDNGLWYSFCFGDGHDQLVIQTSNKNATLNDNLSDIVDFLIVRAEEPILIRTNGIHSFVPGERIYIENTKIFDRNTLISPNTNPGLAGTSFIVGPNTIDVGGKGIAETLPGGFVVSQATITEFEAGTGTRAIPLLDDFGNPITMGTISPNGKTYWELFMENCQGMRVDQGATTIWTTSNLNGSWESGLGTWSNLNYPIVYGNRGVNDENPEPGGDSDVVATRFILAVDGTAYTIKPGGSPRIDNRVALAKAISSFIAGQLSS